ncbi:haloacid dehalogenase [Sorangium cellulosum]|uniref:Haloacid dehalogenase n=1 Tax=Sorangium cellulosum TaxID=56 RepID=A0A4P2QDE7_SORCE|nr:haloacid dehalogenase-like hydrolase [Sorangium cellulosum]AUX27800.1 haloacid dehalogenase [Sorangium cellulosum]
MTAAILGGSAPIPRESTGDLLRRIEAEHGALGAGAALAFDADGTLWEGDIGFDLFDAFLAERAARPEAEEALRREAEAFGVDAGGGAHAIASALHAAFLDERYPEDRAFAMMAWAFAGWREDELAGFVDRVLEEKGHAGRIRPALLPILDWARSRGAPVYVVSASPRIAVERAVAGLGIAPAQVAAMSPAVREGRLAPELGAPATYGDGKIRALGRLFPELAVLAAFGDSAYDAALLRTARVPVAVAPSPKLLAVADTIPGLVLLAT